MCTHKRYQVFGATWGWIWGGAKNNKNGSAFSMQNTCSSRICNPFIIRSPNIVCRRLLLLLVKIIPEPSTTRNTCSRSLGQILKWQKSAAHSSTAFKFGTEFHHVTGDTLYLQYKWFYITWTSHTVKNIKTLHANIISSLATPVHTLYHSLHITQFHNIMCKNYGSIFWDES